MIVKGKIFMRNNEWIIQGIHSNDKLEILRTGLRNSEEAIMVANTVFNLKSVEIDIQGDQLFIEQMESMGCD